METIEVKNKKLPEFAKKFIEITKGRKKFAFYGKMGAGKTTMIKAICSELGANDVVNSPTFALVNEYTSRSGETIFHFDLYRIKNIEELYDIGYEDYFFGDEYLFIEWPELADNILPPNILKVHIEEIDPDSRKVTIS